MYWSTFSVFQCLAIYKAARESTHDLAGFVSHPQMDDAGGSPLVALADAYQQSKAANDIPLN